MIYNCLSICQVVYQHQPTFSADVWSTLCVFVEMLTAKLPGCYKVQRNQNSMLYLVSGGGCGIVSVGG